MKLSLSLLFAASSLVVLARPELAFADEDASSETSASAPMLTVESDPAPVLTTSPPPPAAETPSSSDGPPPARSGFQLAIRGGAGMPFGKTGGTESMSDAFGTQGTFTVDIGGKIGHHFFIGGYLGFGVGGTSGRLEDSCKQVDACATASFRLGAQVQYSVLPGSYVNPWFGYGIGIESTAAGASNAGRQVSVATVGPEFAHFMGGVDFRVSKGFGIGPFVDLSLAQYTSVTYKRDNVEVKSDVEDRQLHQWLQFGVRGVIFP